MRGGQALKAATGYCRKLFRSQAVMFGVLHLLDFPSITKVTAAQSLIILDNFQNSHKNGTEALKVHCCSIAASLLRQQRFQGRVKGRVNGSLLTRGHSILRTSTEEILLSYSSALSMIEPLCISCGLACPKFTFALARCLPMSSRHVCQ